ncbi:hypothetical protein VN24_14145 [Paenibacillus beijingensis]|uniref:Uncharacterized protein n=1 Tax=Paenibacillus beijingensis TaxID=1126833 RepID=A0A0D5NKN8_9BACL|nr:hypothetical protein VN24_14145 [Paenibacillus beijingensis]
MKLKNLIDTTKSLLMGQPLHPFGSFELIELLNRKDIWMIASLNASLIQLREPPACKPANGNFGCNATSFAI